MIKKETVIEMVNVATGLEKVPDKVNLYCGAITTIFAQMLGKQWHLFAGFLLLNIIDYITGWIKAKHFKGNESSKIGAMGVFKKVGYWIVIVIAFFIAHEFQGIGQIIGINLGFTVMIGYFTLATYLINEIRSILENLTEMNVKVPNYLIKGMEVANKKVNAAAEMKETEEKTNADK